MCLTKVVKEFDPDAGKSLIAYKVLDYYNTDKGNTVLETPFRGMRIKLGNTHRRSVCLINSGVDGVYDTPYQSGFHAYKSEYEAQCTCDVYEKVYPAVLEGVRTHGLQGDAVVYVADKITVFETMAEAKKHLRQVRKEAKS